MNRARTIMNRATTHLNRRIAGQRSGGGPASSKARGGGFTLIELLVVIGIIALLAGMIVGGTRYAGTTMRRNRIQAELKQLVTAIEAYRAKFNQYPPDNFVNGIANSVTNQLFYELTGVLVDDDKKKFSHLSCSP